MDNGASVTHAEDNEQAMRVLRGGKGAGPAAGRRILRHPRSGDAAETGAISMLTVARGISNDARAGVLAIHAAPRNISRCHWSRSSSPLCLPRSPTIHAIYPTGDDAGGQGHQARPADCGIGRLRHDHAGPAPQGSAGALCPHPFQPRQAAFISINCAIPEHFSRSPNFFGHEKGALYGAGDRATNRQVRGGDRRHAAARRNLEMDVRLQSKLLRAIQERRSIEAGGTRPVPVDIRIIATSNRNLSDAARWELPEDLLFRLNVVNLKIPPLRERPADILELAQHFDKIPDANGVPLRPLSAEARRVLTTNRWQGNVRELENTIHRSVLMAQGDEIGIDAILTPDGDRLDGPKAVPAVAHATFAAEQVTRALVGRTVADVERDLILETLKHCLGNRTHAANILGISIRTLRNKLNEYSDGGLPITPAGAGDMHRAAVRNGKNWRKPLSTGARAFARSEPNPNGLAGKMWIGLPG